MSLINSINRRNFLITSGSLAGLSVLPWMSPNAAFGADQTLTLALPNNPANFDPAHQANHDTMACSQVVFENLLEVDTDGKQLNSRSIRERYNVREGYVSKEGKYILNLSEDDLKLLKKREPI